MRLLSTACTSVLAFLLLVPAAFAQSSGAGTYGETDDRVVTNAGFIVIAFFPLFILCASLLQWQLDKRKYARKAAAKARAGSDVWKGGW